MGIPNTFAWVNCTFVGKKKTNKGSPCTIVPKAFNLFSSAGKKYFQNSLYKCGFAPGKLSLMVWHLMLTLFWWKNNFSHPQNQVKVKRCCRTLQCGSFFAAYLHFEHTCISKHKGSTLCEWKAHDETWTFAVSSGEEKLQFFFCCSFTTVGGTFILVQL